jgi:cobyrinic acid a,c-diamide synthase
VSIGLGRALSSRGLVVQPFKKGPDYIDPMWLGRATGRPCFNLDFNTQERDEIVAMAAARGIDADLSLIEGNKGLHDGVDLEGTDSNAALAKLLGVPVVLVVDAEGITRGIAPLIVGYRAFDPEVRIAGVIINKIAGPRHEAKLVAAVERYCDVPVLGCLRRDESLAVRERHLGLTTPGETGAAEARVGRIAEAVRESVDLDRIVALASTAAPLPVPAGSYVSDPVAAAERVRIAVARDTAFGFYYPDDLDAMRDAGADLVYFDSMSDRRLPAADGLFIGGGFPETQIEALETNVSLRADIRGAIEAGLPAYAECGGLMYLCRSISFRGECREMVGVVPGEAVMCSKPQGRGQVQLAESDAAPWPQWRGLGGAGFRIHAHEFHFAAVRDLPDGLDYAFEVVRGDGIGGRRDGVVISNLVATFSHQRTTRQNPWARRFVEFVRSVKAARRAEPGGSPTRSHAPPVRAAEATGVDR